MKFNSVLLILSFFLVSENSYSITAFNFFQSNQAGNVKTDSLNSKQDTLLIAKKRKSSQLDTLVVYSSSDSIIFSFKKRGMDMFGDSKIKYGTLNLESNHVNIDWNQNLLFAEGMPDSAGKQTGLPKFVDEGDGYDGFQVFYNFQSRKGRVIKAETDMGDGYYKGKVIKKIEPEVLFISDGVYTTCNNPEPHFHFWGKEMKIIVHDKIIARPIVLRIANIPVFALPFAVLPNKSGRQSGIIPPAYGESAERGIFLRNGGYYWALSDYTDLLAQTDFYSKGGYNLYSTFNYNKRYDFYGSVKVAYTNDIQGEKTDPDYSQKEAYNFELHHHQTFDPTSSLNADLQLMSSSNYYERTSYNITDLSRQEIRSNASYSKQFEDTPWSMSLGFSRTQNLVNEEVRQSFPTFNLSRSATNPFRDDNKPASQQSWYEKITFGYGFSFRNQYDKLYQYDQVNKKQLPFLIKEDYGAEHTPSISIPFPVAKYFTLSPSFSYNEKWYGKTIRKEYNPATKTVESRTVKGFAAARTFSTGVSLSTTLYGLIQPQIGSIKGFRHVLRPSLSYFYTPDFSDDKWGYYKNYSVDSTGRQDKYSIFENSLIGGPGRGRSSSLGISIANEFLMKLEGEKDENGKQLPDKVIPIIRQLSVSTAYNFAADSLQWAPISLSASTNLAENFSISYSSSYTVYNYDAVTDRITRKSLYELGKGLFRSLSQTFSFTLNFAGEKKKNETRIANENLDVNNPLTSQNPIDQQKRLRENVDFDVPYSLNINGSFSYYTPTPKTSSKSALVSYYGDLQMTENWKVSANGGYDFLTKEFQIPTFSVHRDLHCWQMDFNWVPQGRYSYYSLSIHVKAPQLQDIAYKKNDNYGGF